VEAVSVTAETAELGQAQEMPVVPEHLPQLTQAPVVVVVEPDAITAQQR
jgi:hypothetical protein